MKRRDPIRNLFVAPALAPFTGSSDLASAIRDMARGLQAEGHHITIYLPLADAGKANLAGLARRLEGQRIGSKELSIFEGSLEGGEGDLCVITCEGAELTNSDCIALASQSEVKLDLIHLWSETQDALAAARKLYPQAALTLHTSENTDLGLSTDVDLVVVGSRDLLELSEELASKVKKERLYSLSPGYDEREWNPARDSLLWRRLPELSLDAKREAKAALRKELALPDHDAPLIAVLSNIGRLPRSVGDAMVALDAQWVVIDGGKDVRSMANREHGRFVWPSPVSDYEAKQLHHRVVAAADFALVGSGHRNQSRLFPCRYGTALIAPRRGEFADRLVDFETKSESGTAFLYREIGELPAVLARARKSFARGEAARSALIRRNAQLDVSWAQAAQRLNERLRTLL